MNIQLYVHKVLRLVLALSGSVLLILAGTLMYSAHIESIIFFSAITDDDGVTLLTVLLSSILGVMCFSIALFYRQPLHQLSHDAIMNELDSILLRVIVEVHQRNFQSVPQFTHAEAVAQWVEDEYKLLDANHAALIGRIAAVYMRVFNHIGPEELDTLNRRSKDVKNQEMRTKEALVHANVVVSDIYADIMRTEVLASENDEVHADLRRRLAEAEKTLETIAPKSGVNVRRLHI